VLDNGKSKKETHFRSKASKEESKGRTTEKIYVSVYKWQTG
jgi:hypothetical protein